MAGFLKCAKLGLEVEGVQQLVEVDTVFDVLVLGSVERMASLISA